MTLILIKNLKVIELWIFILIRCLILSFLFNTIFGLVLEPLFQADVELEFSFSSLDKAEKYDDKWVDAQEACANKGSNVEGGVGPFGLLTFASEKLEEFTPVFFRIFKDKKKHVILMCSDARRLV